jgi:threonine/homoserine/homoserine lactone efflux protein
VPAWTTVAAFALVSLGLVLAPGPNMIYLVSRSITQGRRAGLISLLGVGVAFVVYLVATCAGLTALFVAAPIAFVALKVLGAAYLLWLAWQAVRPGRDPLFAVRELTPHSPRRLFAMGLVTNLLNPKAAVLYVSLLPQFVDAGRGHVLTQFLVLGATQIVVSLSVNAVWVLTAGAVAGHLARRPLWQRVQRWFMATVLATLAVRLMTAPRQ